MEKSKSNINKSFVSWVGSKRQILPLLIKRMPTNIKKNCNYYEPFVGGGTLFFNIGHLFKHSFLSDVNLDLITSYNTIKYHPRLLYDKTMEINNTHSQKQYETLCQNNNGGNPVEIGAKLIYVNKHSFRGIVRISKNGRLHCICKKQKWVGKSFANTVNQCSVLLQHATIFANDFSFITPKRGDFVYLDPPYHRSGETFYTKKSFGLSEQTRLKEFIEVLNDKGVKIMLSNSNTDFIKKLYNRFRITEIEIKYIPDWKQSTELIITNY